MRVRGVSLRVGGDRPGAGTGMGAGTRMGGGAAGPCRRGSAVSAGDLFSEAVTAPRVSLLSSSSRFTACVALVNYLLK